MFRTTARRRAGLASLSGAAIVLGLAASTAAAVTPTFERALYETGSRPGSPAIGVVDGDALPDVLVPHGHGRTLVLLRNAGGGLLAPAEALAAWPDEGAGTTKLGDFDGDGDLDAVVLAGLTNTFVLLRNDGGAFTEVRRIFVGRDANELEVGDLNGDGRADVVASHAYVQGAVMDSGVRVLLGQADGSVLREHGYDVVDGRSTTVTLHDADADGNLDLLYGEYHLPTGSDGVTIRLGDGAGGFGERQSYDAGAHATTTEPQILDVTADGVADLVGIQANAHVLTTWRGLGGGRFDAAGTHRSFGWTTGIATGDFDGDGRTDIAQASGARVYVHFAFVDGRPDATVHLTPSDTQTYGIAAGDFDADGRDDLITSSHSDLLMTDKIAAFRNTTVVPKACADRLDNDGDGRFDLEDPGCESAADDDETDPPPPPPPAQCADGADNDRDGRTDLDDAGCASASDDDESDDPAPPPPPALPFDGFYAPVNNLPTLNGVQAGRAVPVKFSLRGDRGLDVFAAGYPRSQQVECSSTAEVDGLEETVTAGASGLTYDAVADRYQYVWKTSDAWAGTCRQLVVKLRDGSVHRAAFKLR